MSSSKPRLETSIRQYLVPHLKEDAFEGSGRTFRRVRGEWVQVLNVQGARHGGSFAINLGVHPLLIPDISGNSPDPHKILEPSCELRRRLSESGVDQWWHHDTSQYSMDQAVYDAADVYVRVGRPLLASITGAVSTLHTFTPLDLENL